MGLFVLFESASGFALFKVRVVNRGGSLFTGRRLFLFLRDVSGDRPSCRGLWMPVTAA